MRRYLVLALIVLGTTSLHAQTPYPLPATGCSLQYAPGFYGNGTCSDIPITVNGVDYYLDVNFHVNADNTIACCNGELSFQNLTTDQYDSHPWISGTFTQTGSTRTCTDPNRPSTCYTTNTYQLVASFDVGSASGGSGSIVLNLTSSNNNVRHTFVTKQSGSTLTLN